MNSVESISDIANNLLRNPGYDVIINYSSSSTKAGMQTEQVMICNVVKAEILDFAMRYGSDEAYFASIYAKEKLITIFGETAEQKVERINIALSRDGGQQGNWCVLKTVEEIEYIKFEHGDKFVKTSPMQGRSKLIIRIMHMQQNLDFPYKKHDILEPGAFIGYGGNTGRSNAAHVHIDINDAGAQNNLNSNLIDTIDPSQFFDALSG